MAFGEILRREREKRKLSLEGVAEATKVAARHLASIENDRFDELPGGIFRRSFVRAYARYLGLDERDIVKKYLAASGDAPEELGPLPELPPEKPKRLFTRKRLVDLAALLMLAAAAYFGYRFYVENPGVVAGLAERARSIRRHAVVQAAHAAPPKKREAVGASQPQPSVAAPPAETPQAAQPTVPSAAVAPLPAPPAIAAATQPPAIPSPSTKPSAASSIADNAAPKPKIVLEVRVHGQPAWISISADGLHLFENTMHPGERRTITANENVQVRTGNAGATEIRLNGELQGALGPTGTVARFSYPPAAKPVAWNPPAAARPAVATDPASVATPNDATGPGATPPTPQP